MSAIGANGDDRLRGLGRQRSAKFYPSPLILGMKVHTTLSHTVWSKLSYTG